MSIFNKEIDNLTIKKIMYVLLWSVGLFVATFYSFCGEFDFAAMSTMPALTMAEDYLFPLFMAMALFLLDAQYVMISDGQQIKPVYSACFTIFLLCTVFSILVDNCLFGWLLFIVAWIALTILKASMILDVKGVKIDNN